MKPSLHHKIVIILIVSSIISTKPYKVSVKLKKGTFIGGRRATIFQGRLYYAFYGVPYAQPPVKNLRFKDTKPVKRLKVPYDARTEHHDSCAQAHIIHKHATFGVEDCLYLNIYTPHMFNEETDKRPVIVFYHGYAFTSSFSHLFREDFLIENDIVYITVTYRIGVFGFLKNNFTDTHANMGLKDIVQSLKWIRSNVNHFGGDPRRVTVMGYGSAANLLSLLLNTEKNDLFSKIILHSGSLFSPSAFQGNAFEESDKFKQHMRRMANISVMRASSKHIIAASHNIYTNVQIMNKQRPVVPFTPIVEIKTKKSIINEKPDSIKINANGKIKKVPILIGYSSREGLSEAIPFIHNSGLLKSFRNFFKFFVPFSDGCSYNYSSETYRKIAKKIEQHYFKDGISEKSIEEFLKYTSDLQKYPIYKFINFQLSLGTKMYVFKFNYHGRFNTVKANSLANSNIKVKGAASGDDLCYILKCEPLWEVYGKLSNETNDRDTRQIKDMSEMWANFAKTGNPTPLSYTGNLTWLPMTTNERNILFLSNKKIMTSASVEDKMFTFWKSIYDNYYSDQKCKHMKDEL